MTLQRLSMVLLLVAAPANMARGEFERLLSKSIHIPHTTPALPSHDGFRPPKEKPKLAPGEVRLYLDGGTLITGKLTVDRITVDTQYGPLEVPIDRIRRFTPGLDSRPAVTAKISGLIEKLGDTSLAERETAQKDLLRMGLPVRGELESRRKDDNEQRAKLIEAILKEFEEWTDDDEALLEWSKPLIHRDRIETIAFTIVGGISPKSFTLDSKYGPVDVALADIVAVERDTEDNSEIRKTISVAGTYLVQRGFRSSDIWLEPGDEVMIQASGSIVMSPWGSNKTSSPDGGKDYGWYVANKIHGGTLVAKIGRGEIFKVGAQSKFTAEKSGLLQFAIGMPSGQASSQFPGSYTVKIKVNRKPAG